MRNQVAMDDPIRLSADTEDVVRELAALEHLLNVSPELVERLVHFFKAGGQALRIEQDSTLRTRELRFRLDLTDSFRELMSAFRAGDGDPGARVGSGGHVLPQGTGR